MILSLFQLQAFYFNEIRRGFSGLGEYTVSSPYQGILNEELDTAEHFLPTFSPEEIVFRIKNGTMDASQSSSVEKEKEKLSVLDESQTRCNMSAEARAFSILSAGNISFDPKLHCFNVKGTSGIVRVVTLFPKASCSCPSTGDCYHILAVQRSVGVEGKKEVQHNLSRLRANTRSRRDKKSGRKRPRPADLEPSNIGE